MFKFIPKKFKFMPERLDSIIQGSGGYKMFVFINLGILLLIVVLIVLQQNWINKEKIAIKSIVKSKNLKKDEKEIESTKKSNEFQKQDSPIQLRLKDDLLLAIKKKIKEADLYFEFEQYEKAEGIYQELYNQEIFFEEGDKVGINLAECYFHFGNYEMALETYRNVLNDFLNTPYRLNAQLGIGNCLIQTGDFGEARRILYLLVGQEAKYDKEEDKAKVIEAYYKIAESYIAQAKIHKDKTQVFSENKNM
ncbi:MAG: tetratricopeptide repeat protein [Candidatus Scalindua sp.]|nr:tetratricopeptide repeat protein [Candidatus Scalindua sp.]